MTETTRLPASFSNKGVFESSTAFLMVQKNNNKRQTSMTDDVFRIFRRTGRKITQIANQIEKERGVYLKDSYNNKNALYKELASIPSVKENGAGRRRGKVPSHMPSLPRFTNVNTSDLICRPVKSQLSRQRQGQETELELEKRINVNVLKRCECCRRLAFRYKEMSEKMLQMQGQVDDDDEEEEDKQEKEFRESKFAKEEEKTNSKIQKLSPSRQDETPQENYEQTRLFQYSNIKTSEERIAPNQRVETSFKTLRQQLQANQTQQQSKTPAIIAHSLTTLPSPTKSAKKRAGEGSWSPLFDKCSLTVPQEPSLSPLGRQKIRVKFEHPHLKEKLKVNGKDWSNHLLKLQGKSEGETQTIATLSKSIIAFKKLLRKMEDQRKSEEEMAERSDSSMGSSCAPDSPIQINRLQNVAISLTSYKRSPSQHSDLISLEDKSEWNYKDLCQEDDLNDGVSDRPSSAGSDIDG